MENIKKNLDYLKGWQEGDNITITADFVDCVEELEQEINRLIEKTNSITKQQLTFQQVKQLISEHNARYNIRQQYQDDKPLWFVMVIDNKSFSKEYPLKSRSYIFRSDNKFFLPDMVGSSLFADSLDGTDINVRLDWYIFDGWEIEYCYLLEDENDTKGE